MSKNLQIGILKNLVPPDAVHVQISPIDFLGDLKSVRFVSSFIIAFRKMSQ